jgi:hypothetical protein
MAGQPDAAQRDRPRRFTERPVHDGERLECAREAGVDRDVLAEREQLGGSDALAQRGGGVAGQRPLRSAQRREDRDGGE